METKYQPKQEERKTEDGLAKLMQSVSNVLSTTGQYHVVAKTADGKVYEFEIRK